MNKATNDFLIIKLLLNLRELEDDADESCQVDLGFIGNRLALLKAVECYGDDVLVEKQML